MTLQETMINQELANVDLSKIAALQQKRTLAFVNHFVLTNVQFLNNFMKNCDQKLMEFERKLEKLNASMVLLEARLSSIPELSTPIAAPAQEIMKSEVNENPTAVSEDTPKETETSHTVDTVEPAPSKPAPHPEYDRFVKMVQVGVPLQAVKLKLSLEGLDPIVFDEIMSR